MPKLHTCHLPDITTLFYIGIDRFGQVEALRQHSADIAVSNISEPGGRR
jgi:hypothetical protein